jgi:hypothetical protein
MDSRLRHVMRRVRGKPLAIYLFSVILLISFIVSSGDGKDGRKDGGKQLHSVAQYVRHIHRGHRLSRGSHTLAFFLRFLDFGCVPCLNNFLDFCDTLNTTIAKKGEEDILMVFLRDDNTEQHQLTTLNKWAKVNALPFPIYLASEEVYNRYHIGHSCVVLIDETDEIDFTGEFPLPVEGQEIILHRLFGD